MLTETPPIFALSAFKRFPIAGSDGRIGTIKDFLFVDDRWQVRWLVVDTGTWLSGRKVHIHPSVVAGIDFDRQEILTPLTGSRSRVAPMFVTTRSCRTTLKPGCSLITAGMRIGAKASS
jgi:hypothetical protein